MYLVEIDFMYYENFTKHEDYIIENSIKEAYYNYYDFDEYFTTDIKEIRKIKLELLNENIHSK